MKTTPVIVLAVAVALVVAGAVWFLNSSAPTLPVSAPPVNVAGVEKKSASAGPVRDTPSPAPTTAEVVKVPPAPAPRAIEEWETRIDQVLRTNGTETETAQLLINMLPTLPPQGQPQAAQHISNLILDKDYGRMLPLVKNTGLPAEVHDVFYTDLMNRQDPVKLTTLLEIAKIPNHPYHKEAVTDLQVFLNEENGSNWGKWDTAIQGYLQREKAEAAAIQTTVPPEPAAP